MGVADRGSAEHEAIRSLSSCVTNCQRLVGLQIDTHGHLKEIPTKVPSEGE